MINHHPLLRSSIIHHHHQYHQPLSISIIHYSSTIDHRRQQRNSHRHPLPPGPARHTHPWPESMRTFSMPRFPVLSSIYLPGVDVIIPSAFKVPRSARGTRRAGERWRGNHFNGSITSEKWMRGFGKIESMKRKGRGEGGGSAARRKEA